MYPKKQGKGTHNLKNIMHFRSEQIAFHIG